MSLIHLSANGYLDFHFSAFMNIHVQVLVWTYAFTSLGYICTTGMAGTCGNSMFNLLRKCKIVIQSNCNIIKSHQK